MRLFFLPKWREDKGAGFALIEALLTIGILGMVLVAMTPIIHTVYTAWEFGSKKTELQQNARTAIEMMSRLIRQAKRITGIPNSGSGIFVKFRNALDNQTIIFYHNIQTTPPNPYYIGESGLIRVNDLVMRTTDINATVNALLAKSLNDLRIDFRDDTGTITAIPYNVASLDISMSLSDPGGSETINIFSNISLRPQVRIDKAVWVALAQNIVELSLDNWLSGFLNPRSVSVNSADGTCWVADTGNHRIKKLAPDGKVLLALSGFNSPSSVSVNYRTGDCWVADTGNNKVKKIPVTGPIIEFTGFSSPKSVSINPTTGDCWVADTGNNRVKKILPSGTITEFTGFRTPQSVSVNSTTGDCWVADTGNNRVRRILANGNIRNFTGFRTPQSVSVNSTTGDCWVADTGNNRVRRILANGNIRNFTGFNTPQSVSVNSTTADCWVADTGNNQVVKLDADGNEEFRISGFSIPLSVASRP
jgi:DNA-binding beta-propeller fold protein YncE